MTMTDTAPRAARTGLTRKTLGAWAIRLGALAMFAAILIYFAATARGFANPYNIMNVVEQSAILGLLAFGMSVVLIGGGSEVQTGGIDLSLAANTGLCAAVFANLSQGGTPEAVAIAAALATGMAIGLLNAIAVVRLHILPLLATLAVMNIAAGLELTVTQNTVISVSSPFLMGLAMGSFLGISSLAWVFIVFSALMVWGVHFSRMGLRLYAVGGHREAARASGLNVDRYVTGTYVFAGLCAGLASVLIVARLSSSTPGTGQLLLSVLAASLLGTVFSRRFIPTMGGTILSVLFIGFLANGFQLSGVSSYWVNGVQGALILLVVAVTSFARPSEG
ncbi:ABC transporter permease [Falsirhodobacter halotolerans]|uniref:ABC transporter permease n=1 Tax=Falsirhodobacter halotolerans TaxID=1146892 RepID=UPI001FD34F69|nr:ABC transporter permease [Falsirhodobacter halotolerans]MCJ8139151.1 ABC transporter permease [Falsirhodobacter halotolerans]